MNYDLYLVGVGGQGILTIGELLAEAAAKKDLPLNFFPSRGMAQRGGFVKAQLRLGRQLTGPNIPERSADLVIAMEQSEALKAVRYLRPGGDFLLYDDVWQPTAVMLGKAPYPALETLRQAVLIAQARWICISPSARPVLRGEPAAANLFTLGAALAHTSLGQVFSAGEVSQAIRERWARGAETNAFALEAGLACIPTENKLETAR